MRSISTAIPRTASISRGCDTTLAGADIAFNVAQDGFTDPAGGLALFIACYGAANPNVPVSTAVNHLYSSLGLSVTGNAVTGESFDDDGDEITDEISTYAYDGNGHLTTYTLDDDNDGTVDVKRAYTRDAFGRITEELDSRGAVGDGTFHSTFPTTFSYSAAGALMQEVDETDEDGVKQIVTTTTWTYDASNRPQTSVVTQDGGDSPGDRLGRHD